MWVGSSTQSFPAGQRRPLTRLHSSPPWCDVGWQTDCMGEWTVKVCVSGTSVSGALQRLYSGALCALQMSEDAAKAITIAASSRWYNTPLTFLFFLFVFLPLWCSGLNIGHVILSVNRISVTPYKLAMAISSVLSSSLLHWAVDNYSVRNEPGSLATTI